MKIKNMILNILKPFVPQIILTALLNRRQKKKLLNERKKSGYPNPPTDLVKQIIISEYQQRYNYSTLVETGTYMGDMVEAQKRKFKKIISIELGIDLFKEALIRFENDKNVLLVHGDSGTVLPKILLDLNEPAIFWLDGHYSEGITAKGDKDCPIFEELDAIFNARKFNHVLLIDDARCFNGEGDWPTLDQLSEYIKSKNEKYQIKVKHDIIRCTIENFNNLTLINRMKKNNILSQYSNNVFSQKGEDGILQRILEILPNTNKWCVEFGAWDGKYYSNCCNLITNYDWSGVMIEANKNKFLELQNNYQDNSKAYLINRYIEFEGKNRLDSVLKDTPIPKDFDLLSIDIDGNDYYVWESFIEYRPKIVVIEFNPTIPSDIEFIQERNMKINQGSSLLSINILAQSKGYELIGTTNWNAIYVIKEYFELFGIENNNPSVIWDTEDEAPRIFQLFDGTIVLSKEFDLLWSGLKVNKLDLQKLPKQKRVYDDSQNSYKVLILQKLSGLIKRFLSLLRQRL